MALVVIIINDEEADRVNITLQSEPAIPMEGGHTAAHQIAVRMLEAAYADGEDPVVKVN